MTGAASSSTVEKSAPSASASRKAWKTSASARSRRPAPSARAIADETPTPMPLLVVCRTIITQGKASEAPEKEAVEGDDAGEGEQVEDVRRRQAQQRRQDRRFEQHLGACRRGRGRR